MPGLFPNPTDSKNSWQTPSEVNSQLFSNYLTEVVDALRSDDWVKADKALNLIKSYQIENDNANLINTKKLKAELRYNQLNIFNSNKLGRSEERRVGKE